MPAHKRLSRWVEIIPGQMSPGSATQTTKDLSQNLPKAIGHTLIRLLLQLHMWADVAEASGDMIRLDYGVAMVQDDAISAGAFPDPSEPEEIPWIMRDTRMVIDDGSNLKPDSLVTAVYDIRTMRIFRRADEQMRLIVDNTATIGGGVAQVVVTGRYLVKMP